MAKELPYFQFEPAEYLTKDISFCSLKAQGLFVNLCSYYWQRGCKLTKDQLLRRLDYIDEFDELIDEGVIDLKDDGQSIIVKFLDKQYDKATNLRKTNSLNGSKGGRPKKNKQNKTEIKPKQNPNESESKGIREDKIREDKKNNILDKFIVDVKKGGFDSQIEAMYMRLKIRKGTLTPLLKEYNLHLIEDSIKHKTTQDFFKHFKNWLNTQDRLGKLDKHR